MTTGSHDQAGSAPEKAASTAAESPAEPSPVEKLQSQALEAQVIEAIRTCFDPEIPVNVYDLGLIYDVQIDPAGKAEIKMTLTSPMCPVAGTLPPEVAAKAKGVEGVTDANVEVVWDPPWTPDKMSEAAKLQLNL